MRRSYFSADEIIIYLNEELKRLFQIENPLKTYELKLDTAGVPLIEKVIVPEENKIIAMGFPCVSKKEVAFIPIVASFVQYSLVQNSNQQLSVPYSQITQSYHDSLKWLDNNKDICKTVPNNIVRSQFSSRARRRVNAGF